MERAKRNDTMERKKNREVAEHQKIRKQKSNEGKENRKNMHNASRYVAVNACSGKNLCMLKMSDMWLGGKIDETTKSNERCGQNRHTQRWNVCDKRRKIHCNGRLH